jgi:hypothetical protein
VGLVGRKRFEFKVRTENYGNVLDFFLEKILMMILDYMQSVGDSLGCPHTKKLFQMSQRIIEKTSKCLWRISGGRNEFEQYRILLDGSLKHPLTAAALGRDIAAEGSRLATWSPPRSSGA